MKKLLLLFAFLGVMMFQNITAQTVIASGDCGANGNNLTWELTDLGVLTINGSGAMADFAYGSPWYAYNNSISSLTIGNSITSIGNYAFRNCGNLTSVTIPNSVTNIGERAFYSCFGIASLTIGSSVAYIGRDAFISGVSFLSITCLATVPPTLAPDALGGISDNAYLCVPVGTLTAYQNSSWNAYFNSYFPNIRECAVTGPTISGQITSNNLPLAGVVISYAGGSTITATDGTYSLMVEENSSVTLTPSLSGYTFTPDSIACGMVANDLTGMNFTVASSNGTNVIASGYCGGEGSGTNLVWVLTSDEVLTISGSGSMVDFYALPSWAPYASSISTLVIGNAVTDIGNLAFASCSSLTSATIPNSVTSIGNYAFGDCSSLTSVTIPNSVTHIGNSAFLNCSGLSSITCLATTPPILDYNSFYNVPNYISVCVPTGSIANYQNSMWGSLFTHISKCATMYTISGRVTDYGNPLAGVIISHAGGSTITAIDGTYTLSVEENSIVTLTPSLSGYTFTPASIACGTVTNDLTGMDFTVASNNGTSVIASGYCGGEGDGTNLVWVLTSDGVLTISGSGAMADYYNYSECPWYYYVNSVFTLAIDSTVTNIGNYAFWGCGNLTSVTIPYSVTNIGNQAFEACSGLTSITIPNSVTNIGDLTFANCYNLTSITCLATVPPSLGYNSFSGMPYNVSICIPIGTLMAYQNSNWNHLLTNINECATMYTISGQVTDYGNPLAGVIISHAGRSTITTQDGTYTLPVEENSIVILTPSLSGYTFTPDSIACGMVTNDLTGMDFTVASSNGTYVIASGYCGGEGDGTNLVWVLTSDGILTINGSGIMADYFDYYSCPWYYYVNYISTLALGNAVTGIGNFSFFNCSNLTSVTIPNSVTNIGNNAFTNCNSLTSVIIGNSVTNIGNQAFEACSGLTSITISNSVTNIGESAFANCWNLSSITCLAAIPPSLGYNSFSGMPYNVSVCIPFGTLMAYQSSDWNYYFANINECETMYAINGQVTSSGNALAGVIISYAGGSTITAQDGTYTLYVEENSTVTLTPSLRGHTFTPDSIACGMVTDSLTGMDFTVASGNGTFVIASGYCGGEGDGTNLVWVLTSDGVLTISGSGIMADYSSYYSCPWYYHVNSISTIILGNAVTTIEDHAFSYCENLTLVKIPNSVISIGAYAFYGCNSLTLVTIPNSVNNIGESAFRGCRGLYSITCLATVPPAISGYICDMPNNISVCVPVGSGAYYQNSAWGSNFTNISECAVIGTTISGQVTFNNLPLAGVVISYADGLTITGSDGTYTLTVEENSIVTLTPSLRGNTFAPSSIACGMVTDNLTGMDFTVTSTNGTTVIASGYCGGEGDGTNLVWVLTSDGVLTISGSGIMADYIYYTPWYSYLNSISMLAIDSTVTGLGNFAFSECSGITSVTIPNSVINIGMYAFGWCNSLTSVAIGNSVTNIGGYAFYNCNNLASITIPNSVTGIGDFAFSGCFSITSVTIPNSVTDIGDNAFINCQNLTSVTIGNSVTNIGDWAFANCNSLSSITCLATFPPVFGFSSFFDISYYVTVCVPASSIMDYLYSAWGSNFDYISGCAPVFTPQPITTAPTGISETDEEQASLVLYPNPVRNTLQIQSSSPVEQFTLYDISGRVLKQILNPSQSIDMSDLAKGIYLVKVKTETGEIVRKVIKD